MRLTVTTGDGRVEVLEVEDGETIDNLCALVEVIFGVTTDRQVLLHNGNVLNDASSTGRALTAAGVKNEDLLVLEMSGSAAAAGSATSGARRTRAAVGGMAALHLRPPAKRRGGVAIDRELWPSIGWEDVPAGIDVETLYGILQVNSDMLAQIERRDPAMHAAARSSDASALRTLLMQRNLSAALPEAEAAARLAQLESRLASNPYDLDAQRQLEAIIAEKNIRENMELAMEHMPEAFARVTMLYIPSKINGHDVKIFVDSGAQTTILSKKCAERCGVMRLVDTHFSGQAVGVGTARIIGRVHMAPLEVAGQHFSCTFTVLDQDDMDCLLGLDMLKRYQSCIDLKASVLRLQLGDKEVVVPFLGDADIPKGVLGGDSGEERTDGSSTHPATGGASAATGGAGTAPGPATAAAPAPAGGRPSGSGSMMATPPAHSTIPAAASGPSGAATASSASGRPSTASTSSGARPGGVMAPLSFTFGGGGTGGSGRAAAPATGPAATAARPAGAPSTASTAPAAAGTPFSTRSGGSGTMFAPLNLAGLGAGRPASASTAATTVPAGSGTAGSGGGFTDAQLTPLLALGFPRDKCVQALLLAGGNVAAAAALLPDL